MSDPALSSEELDFIREVFSSQLSGKPLSIPAFMVDGEASDIASELGVLCFEDAPASGTEVTAIWHELSIAHTF